MLEQGVASAEDIDLAMELGYRHPMGPLKLTDLVGLDVRLLILDHLHKELGEQFRPPSLLRQMVRAGRLGRKVGRGFYDYAENKPDKK
jgi:3-hydroxybutyryl-CoA dehydrogenase